MSRRAIVMCFGLFVVLSMLITSCGPAAKPAQPKPATPSQPSSGTASNAKPIVIGVPAIQTGSDTYIHGELIVYATNFAADEINAKGGVLGRPLKILVMDDAGDPKQGVNVAHAFCTNPEVVAVLGHAYSGTTLPALPVYKEANMPVIVHGTNPLITELGYDNIVQNTPNDLITGYAAADHAKDVLKIGSVAIVHNKSLWGAGVASVFRTRCEEIGIKVTSYQGVDPTDVDFTPVLTAIKNEKPDALYFAGYTEQGLMRKQMVQLGMDKTMRWLAAEATSSEYIDITKDMGVGTLSATAAPPLDFREEMKAFDERFYAKYQKHPESWSAYYYDMVYAIADAIKKAGSDKREDIVKALRKIDVPSVVYPEGLQFDDHGRVVHPVSFVYELGPDLKYKTTFVWKGEPPYKTMSADDYKKIIDTLK
ncbi:MAG: branched-chain amino acid ABC transporter substrate-binding protein [Ignavibacteriales bacterium]